MRWIHLIKHGCVGLMASCMISLMYSKQSVESAPQEVSGEMAKPLWAHQQSDIEPDPRAIYGVLDNGFRYVLVPNKEPPERISLRLWVNTGSLYEEDQEQGLAHFLEHMAFLGTKHFDPKEQIEYFQRLGMRFGADTNAHTGFEETAYKLELPDASESLVRDSLQLLRDYAGELLILADQVEREKGVILSEKRDRDGAGYRTLVARYRFLFDGLRLVDRFPIGRDETISAANRELLDGFYRKWYVPSRMVLIVSGDLDVDQMKGWIHEYFSNLQGSDVPAIPDRGKLAKSSSTIGFHREQEQESVQIGVYCAVDYDDELTKDTKEQRFRDLLILLANDMLTQRLEKLSLEADAGFSRGYAWYESGYESYILYQTGLRTLPAHWKKGLQVAVTELRRAIQYGFLPQELTEAKARIIRRFEAEVEAVPTRHSAEITDSVMRAVADNRVYSSPEYDLKLLQEMLPEVTLERVNQVFEQGWKSAELRAFLTGNLPVEVNHEVLTEEWQRLLEVDVVPPQDLEVAEFAYQEFGEKGSIVEKQYVEDLDISLWRLSNGVRVNFKKTDFENDRIRIQVRVEGGALTMPLDKPGLILFADLVMLDGGLGKHSAHDLHRMFSGKMVNIQFAVDGDAFVFSATTSPEDLHEQLLLITAWLTDPGFRSEGLRRLQEELPVRYSRMEQTPEGNWKFYENRWLLQPDNRLYVPERQQVEERTMDDLRAWIMPALRNGYMEVAVVGDVQEQELESSLLETLGALPARDGKPLAEDSPLRRIEFKKPAPRYEKKFVSEFPRALSVVTWPTVDFWKIDERRQLQVLNEIFRDRLRVRLRAEMGDVYSPFSYAFSDEDFNGYGILVGGSLAGKDVAGSLADIIRDTAQKLAEGEIDEDMLERARQPILRQIRDNRRNNQYWLASVLSRAQSRPVMLEQARTITQAYEGYTLEDIRRIAAHYLLPDRSFLMVFTPHPSLEPVDAVAEIKEP
jgi:zinc protease